MSLGAVFMSEVIGTAILILLGCGVVANNVLPRNNGFGGGFLMVNFGWGLAVFAGVYAAYKSGAHLNPAVTVGLGVRHLFEHEVTYAPGVAVTLGSTLVYLAAEVLGAFIGAVLAWAAYKKQFDDRDVTRDLTDRAATHFTAGPHEFLWGVPSDRVSFALLAEQLHVFTGELREIRGGSGRLVEALADRGLEGRWVVWDDPSVDWTSGLVAVRATWDYETRLPEFLAWTRRVPRLLNSAELFAWNTDKAYLAALAGAGLRVGIVRARFNAALTTALLQACRAELAALGVAADDLRVVEVPGALEVPLALQALALHGGHDALIALGCVIRGETYHFEIVSDQSAAGIMQLGVKGLAIGNGILTTEDEDQAWARARLSEGDKGGGAAKACLDLIALRRRLRLGLGA